VNLSIFNFNKIYRIVIIFVVLFIFYNVYLIVQKPNVTMLQNQWQNNYSFAQDFIYDNKAKNIIVGSSMAARIQNKFLPKNYYNLSFSGGSVLTGLEIIKRSGFIPKNIYIENNIIFRHEDNKLLNILFYPFLWEIKKYVPSLREKYQPLNLIISKIKGAYGKTHDELLKISRDNNIYDLSMKRQQKNYDKNLKQYDIKLKQLKNLVKYFEVQGTKITFFEMPIDINLAKSIKAKEQRNVIKVNFKNNWMRLPDNDEYTTTDGIHLIYKSAYEYSDEFLKLTRRVNE